MTSEDRSTGPGLQRQIGLGSATAIIVASVIGQGIFTTTGFLGHDIQHPGIVLLLWVLGGALAMAGAFSYAELGSLLPRAGGEYAFLHAAFGPRVGFLCGWAEFLGGFSAPVALCALVFSEHLAAFFPVLRLEEGLRLSFPWLAVQVPLGNIVAASLILLLTAAHFVRVSGGVRIQNLLTILKALGLSAFFATALLSGKGETSRLFEKGAVPPLEGLLPSCGTGLVFVMLTYAGWNAPTYLAGEVKEPERVLPLSAVLGTLLVSLIYVSINILYLMSIPVKQMEAAPNIAVLSAEAYFGQNGKQVISLLILITQLACVSSLVLAGSRVYFAMGQDGVAWRGLAAISGPGGVPRRAVLLQGAVGALMALFLDFRPLALYAGLILLGISGLTVASLFTLRRRARGAQEEPRRRPLRAVLPSAYVASTGVILLFAFWDLFQRGSHNHKELKEIGTVALCLAAGVPACWLSRAGGGSRRRRAT